MSPEAQRIAIAEACGWKYAGKWAQRPLFMKDGQSMKASVDALPSYLTDLNAMHEAEKVLTGHRIMDYCVNLGGVTWHPDVDDWFAFLHATAAQRAEAFLRTLGLWQEGAPDTKRDGGGK